ncbi:MAG: endolytic transglycosylase MltG [Oscillospiraceae bacterium]|jgi:UPF0755 protein|nr:endolytic transglycosylase MltG [Oscillospiraceae bacterium]
MLRRVLFILAACLLVAGVASCDRPSDRRPSDDLTSAAESIFDATGDDSISNRTAPPSVTYTNVTTIRTSTARASFGQPNVSTTAAPTTVSATTPRQEVTVLIPEGYSFWQIMQTLENKGVCTGKAFYDAAQAYQVQSFSIGAGSQVAYKYEGYLYPDTYHFYIGDNPVDVLKKMLNNYAAKSGMPDWDTLILASLIQAETRSPEHMAMVSSVFHNRLKKGMQLQADATKAYVSKQIVANPEVLLSSQYENRYDTYQCKALPIGPIGNPGHNAITAAKNPASSDYLYYFFGKDNTNHYSKTFDEHVAQMRQYGVG